MTVHPKFPQWYATFQIQHNEERTRAREAAIGSYINSDDTDVETLLALALGLKRSASDADIAAFRQAFLAEDPSFPDDNARETQLLAAVTLATILAGDDDLAAYAALATSTSLLGGARAADLPMNLADIANAAVERIAEANSTRPELGSMTPQALPKWDFSTALTKVVSGEADAMSGLVQALSTAFRKDLNAQREHQKAVLEAMERFVTVQDEELQILWWLVGGRSKILDVNFDKLSVVDRPFVLAMELAELTQAMPGPASVRGLLSKAGVAGKKSTIAGAMSPSYDFLQKASKAVPSAVCHPLHFAIKRMEEFEGKDGWATGWAAACGVKDDASLSPLDLAELFYREELLLRLG